MKVIESLLEVLGGVFFSLLTYIPAPLFLLIIASGVSGGSGSGLGGGLAPLFIMFMLGIALLLQLWLTYKFSNKGFVQLGIWLVYPVAFFSYQPLVDFNKARIENNHQAYLEKKKREAVYYRLKASYRHKDRNTGRMEKIEFDLVADLEVKYFMKPTADGGAVLIYLPGDAYHKDYRFSHVPDDYMPFAVWFDDVHDTRFGWGYGSEDAYESPRSQLKFEGATLIKQNYTQWQAWRKQQKAIFKPIGSIQSPFGWSGNDYKLSEKKYFLSDHRPNPHYVTTRCYSHRRIRLKGTLKKLTHKLWPANRPTYWMLPFYNRVKKSHKSQFKKLQSMISKYRSYDLEIGVETRKGGGELIKDNDYANNDDPFYPTIHYRKKHYRAESGWDIERLDTRPKMKGFYACGSKDFASLNRVLRVKKRKAHKTKRPFYINNVPLINDPNIRFRLDDDYRIYKDKVLWISYTW